MGEAVGSDNSTLRQRVSHSTRTPSAEVQNTDDVSKSSRGHDGLIPPAKWTFNKDGFPQAIAHRGYKAEYPENTMGAFRGAIEVGAHAIETDLHLSKDDVVVISHDKDLKRCYGEDALVRERTWAELSKLRTLKEPRQPMPRLTDLLDHLATPGNESTWLLLDIKIDDPAEHMIKRLAETLRAAAPTSSSTSPPPWNQRVVLGCWTAAHLRLCHAHLPDYAIAWIGITVPMAREFLRVPNVAINIRQEPLSGFDGRRLARDCRAMRRPLYTWTVDEEAWMRWAIRGGLDAVITDDPRRYLEVCERYRREQKGEEGEEEGEGEGKEEGRGMAAGVVSRARGGLGVVARVRGFLFSLCLPVLIPMFTRRLRYYERMGTVAENRERLKDLVES